MNNKSILFLVFLSHNILVQAQDMQPNISFPFPISDADRIANSDKLYAGWISVLSLYPFGNEYINNKLIQLVNAIPTIARADIITRYQYAVDSGRFLGSLSLVDYDPYLNAFQNTILYAVTGKPSLLHIAGTMCTAPSRTARVIQDQTLVEQDLFKKILKLLGLPDVPL